MSTPPPLPPRPDRSDALLDALSQQSNTPVNAAPPKKGLSGCAIAAIVGVAVLLLGIVLTGILAAIALPQYQEYVLRTHLMRGALGAEALQPLIDAQYRESGVCPDNSILGVADDPAPIGPREDPGQITVHTRLGEQAGQCTIELRFASRTRLAVDDKTLLYVADGQGGWDCSGGTLPTGLRPSACRGTSVTP